MQCAKYSRSTMMQRAETSPAVLWSQSVETVAARHLSWRGASRLAPLPMRAQTFAWAEIGAVKGVLRGRYASPAALEQPFSLAPLTASSRWGFSLNASGVRGAWRRSERVPAHEP